MAFDRAGAKAAGYTDDQIDAYLMAKGAAGSAQNRIASGPEQSPMPSRAPSNLTRTALGLLPAAGGTIGALAGGAGGTVFGMGVGGFPGAVGGGTLGSAGGEAARQLAMRAMGYEAPETAGEAAGQIGMQGALGGGLTAATLGAGRALQAVPAVGKTALHLMFPGLGKGAALAEGLAQTVGKGATNAAGSAASRAVAGEAATEAEKLAAGELLKRGTANAAETAVPKGMQRVTSYIRKVPTKAAPKGSAASRVAPKLVPKADSAIKGEKDIAVGLKYIKDKVAGPIQKSAVKKWIADKVPEELKAHAMREARRIFGGL